MYRKQSQVLVLGLDKDKTVKVQKAESGTGPGLDKDKTVKVQKAESGTGPGTGQR